MHAGRSCDGIHIPPAVLGVLLRAKGMARSLLVTDATAGAAAPPGLYRFAGMAIERSPEGAVRVPGTDRLAGSALCLDQAVRNLVAWGLTQPAEAIRLASANPAAVLAPALATHGLHLPRAAVTWTDALQPGRVAVAGEEIIAG